MRIPGVSALDALRLLTGIALAACCSPHVTAAAPSAAQPPSDTDLTVVLVHGAWADGSSWSDLIPLPQQEGLHVVAVQSPLSGLADDVAATQRAMDG